MTRLLRASLAVVFVLGTASMPARAECSGTAFFLGAIYDTERRNDFQQDVDRLNELVGFLRTSHCIPEANAKILAFNGTYSRNGVTYPAATEGAIKQNLTAFGEQASQIPGAILFYVHSSHGSFAGRQDCPGGDRVLGSLAAVGRNAGENGTLYDCEFAEVLNASVSPETRVVTMFDCSFCGGFSDSLTAASGTVNDQIGAPSGILGPNRIVLSGCAVTTECFGSPTGSNLYAHMTEVLKVGVGRCDGFTAPGFPLVQGIDAPAQVGEQDGACSLSEVFFAGVDHAYRARDAISIQQQFRIKYGFGTLAEDIEVI